MNRKNLKGTVDFFQQGGALLWVLVLGVIASLFLGGMIFLTSLQFDYMLRSAAYEEALAVAEAGVHYYQWHLAHAPEDYQDGTGAPGPYVHEYRDPQGGVVGTYSLQVTPPAAGSTIVTVVSTGSTSKYPGIKRTVKATYGIPSFARYAFLHNSTIFFGQGVTVHGTVMANGGIRQDGINDSTINSAQETYTCGQETGCNPPTTMPGVWGSGGDQDLWEYPVPPVDFGAVSVAFNRMRADAQAVGVYRGDSPRQGYHVVFREDGTFDLYEVTRAGHVRGLGKDGRCTNIYQEIQNENFLGNYSLADKHIVFLEDTTWVEGIVNGRVTVVAARFPIDSNNVDMWINNTTRYAAKNGQSQLGLIAQRSIFFIRDLPADFELNAALMAQRGSVFRHGYHIPGCGNNGNQLRTSFTLYGSVISGEPSAWNWGTPPGSGFVSRTITHDNNLSYNPPPYFPLEMTYQYQLISWSEENNP